MKLGRSAIATSVRGSVSLNLTVGALALLVACGSGRPLPSDPETWSTKSDERHQLALVDSQTGDEAVFALFENEGMRLHGPGVETPPSRQLIAAGWENGRVVWRTGPPEGSRESLATALVEPAVVQDLVRELAASVSAWDGRSFSVPDGGYHEVILRVGDRRGTVATCHEVFEADPRLVSLEGGVGSLGGRTREEVLAQDASPDWLAFRAAWASLRAKLVAIVETASAAGSEPFPSERIHWVWK